MTNNIFYKCAAYLFTVSRPEIAIHKNNRYGRIHELCKAHPARLQHVLKTSNR